MHTLRVIAGGLLLLGLFVAAGRYVLGTVPSAKAAMWFIPVWLLVSLINMWVGVLSAGYTVAQEAPILLAVFGVPAVAAIIVRWMSADR